uniref:Reverse transcriptase Ty1/copia-type domain-containing protein n=1 Tax=Nicotiana tabacum TaxID=4097 RepID=A0A1S4CFH4_TOBAC|nr:PREDICTED: uncharacterized protein LOC107818252 [Nicotiana tabacum]
MGNKVLSLARRKIHISTDVVFCENVFPFTLSSTYVSLYNVFKLVSFPTYIEGDSTHPGVQSSEDITSPGVHQHSKFSPVNDTSTHTSDTPFPYASILAASYEATSHSSPTSTQSETPILRKSNRTHKTPTYLKDYICTLPNTSQPATSQCSPSLNALFSNLNHITHDVLCSESQHLVTNICHDSAPSSYREATLNPTWQAAMTQEFDALHANHTWDLVPLLAGKQAIGCKWVYKVKHKVDRRIERLNYISSERLYSTSRGYTETFSPVVKMTTVRVLVTVVVNKSWDIFQLGKQCIPLW